MRYAISGVAGSSPRVRGTRSEDVWVSVAPAVHPRVCGEHRGYVRHGPRIARFIPACAGNTNNAMASSSIATVHPRVCGEHGFKVMPAVDIVGSSPRVRGTPKMCHSMNADVRFIPACAGNTAASRSPCGARAVHPRVCGEHRYIVSVPRDSVGSSPRVRGTPRLRAGHGRHERFIPACAGNTKTRRCATQEDTVHPRVCGEHATANLRRAGDAGSSPRVRGTLRHPRAA